MSENPLQVVFQTAEKVSSCIQIHFSKFIAQSRQPRSHSGKPLSSLTSPTNVNPSNSDTHTTSNVRPHDILHKELMLGVCSIKVPIEKSDVNVFTFARKSTAPVTKEELGRNTWVFLHTLAAQYPDNPTKQQKKDVKELMAILSRMYPCKECADHFKEVLRANPVMAGSHADFSQWLCQVHNVVNRSLGKPVFPCERVDARWGKLECEQRACDVLGSSTSFGDEIR